MIFKKWDLSGVEMRGLHEFSSDTDGRFPNLHGASKLYGYRVDITLGRQF